MYGKVHNEITYKGITNLKVGDSNLDLVNQTVELTSENDTINIEVQEDNQTINFDLKNQYIKENERDNIVFSGDISIPSGSNGILKIKNIKYKIVDLSEFIGVEDISIINKDNQISLQIKENDPILLFDFTNNVTSDTNFTQGQNSNSKSNLQAIIDDLYRRIESLEQKAVLPEN